MPALKARAENYAGWVAVRSLSTGKGGSVKRHSPYSADERSR